MAQELPAYTQSTRFPTRASATRAYQQVERLLSQTEESELSAFNFELEGVAIVAVIGDLPDGPLHEQLAAALKSGEPTVLPESVLRMLHRRRQEQRRLAPWVERHHRPGRLIRVEDEEGAR